MAQAIPPDDADDDIDSLINCGICLSEMEQPKALICLHSFCATCLKQVKHPPGKISCPLCKEDTILPKGGVEGLRDNFFVNQMKEKKIITRTGDVKMICICCGATDRVSIARCVDCNGFLCEQCVDSHAQLGPLKGHAVFKIEELRSGKVNFSKVFKDNCCDNHKDQISRFFCKTCGIPICHVCTVVEHCRPDHDYITLGSAAEYQMEEIEGLLKSCRDVAKRIDAAIGHEQKVKIKLKSAIGKASRHLLTEKEKAKEDILKLLEDDYNFKTHKLQKIDKIRSNNIDSNKEKLTNLKVRLMNATELANQVLASGSKHDVASNYTTLTSTLKQLKAVQVEPTSDDVAFVTFTPDRSIQAVKPLGKIREHKEKPVFRSAELLMEIGKEGEGKLTTGVGVAMSNVDIAVADFGEAQVNLYRDGQYQLSLDTKQGLQKGQRSYPWNVAVSSDRFYVTDRTGMVKIYSSLGRYLKQFPVKSPDGTSSDTDDSKLRGLTIDNEGYLLVGNNTKKYICRCTQDGTHITSFKIDIDPDFIVLDTHGLTTMFPVGVTAMNSGYISTLNEVICVPSCVHLEMYFWVLFPTNKYPSLSIVRPRSCESSVSEDVPSGDLTGNCFKYLPIELKTLTMPVRSVT